MGGEGREGEGKGLVGTNNVNIDRKKAEIAQYPKVDFLPSSQ